MDVDDELCSLIERLGISPVLVDIGAASAPPGLWRALGPVSTYVGFEPDVRDRPSIAAGHFKQAFVIDAAAGVDENATDADFYFTAFPHCSSLLPPYEAELGKFLFAHEFVVDRCDRVPVTTIAATLAKLGLERIDWLKCDSQGTDVRLFATLPAALRDQLSAVDLEPGLITGYADDDSFVAAQNEVLKRGFWLSRLGVGRATRMREATLDRFSKEEPWLTRDVMKLATKTPAWVNCRYLRELDSISSPEAMVIVGAFALLDDQPGFVLDLVIEFERRWSSNELVAILQRRALQRLRSLI